ncbi:MAG: amidohydrolase [Candidatus Tectimicrobiota bacterium]|nr:MAG: amidohydrolase [Candidatus Tectomicrobia bacterium]
MPSLIVLRHALLIDGTGREPLPDATVVVEGRRIKEVGAGAPGVLPATAQVLDVRGHALLPGLIDAHVHVCAVDANLMEQHRRYPASLVTVKAVQVLAETLAQGFTTVRDAGGADWGLQQAQVQGLIAAPRLLISGRALSQTGGHGDMRCRTERGPLQVDSCSFGVVCDGVDEVRRAAREQLRQGANQLKVMASGGAMSPTDELHHTQFGVEELQAAVAEARAAGTYVMAHAYTPASIANCLAAGVRSIEHGNFLDAATAQAMRQAGAFLVPTLATYELLARHGKDYGVPEANLRKIREALATGQEAVRLAAAAGVRIASGSDLLGPMQSQRAVELELKAEVLTPMGALVATTRTNAELLGLDHELGTVEAGKLADLLVVRGNPLEDIRVLQAYRESLLLIMQEGRLYKNTLGG